MARTKEIYLCSLVWWIWHGTERSGRWNGTIIIWVEHGVRGAEKPPQAIRKCFENRRNSARIKKYTKTRKCNLFCPYHKNGRFFHSTRSVNDRASSVKPMLFFRVRFNWLLHKASEHAEKKGGGFYSYVICIESAKFWLVSSPTIWREVFIGWNDFFAAARRHARSLSCCVYPSLACAQKSGNHKYCTMCHIMCGSSSFTLCVLCHSASPSRTSKSIFA